MIRRSNIRNYSIYLKDDVLFSYLEYHGSAMQSDWAKMAAHKKTQGWRAITQACRSLYQIENRENGGRRWAKCFTWIDL